MKECSKSIARRLSDPNFASKYFVGHGLDIGGKPDPLSLYVEFFPLMEGVRTWDLEDGDAQYLAGVEDHSFDFVHSSHCLEHLADPREGLNNWLRVLKPGGYIIIAVPDEDLYEQGVFPSTFNKNHKWTFTIYKKKSWSPKSINVLDLITELGATAEPVKIHLLDSTYRFDLPRYDQTLTPVGECGIEIVLRKRTEEDLTLGGRIKRSTKQPPREIRLHLNQHVDDTQTLKNANVNEPPFTNDKPI